MNDSADGAWRRHGEKCMQRSVVIQFKGRFESRARSVLGRVATWG